MATAEKTNIFLTGAPGVGKSTIIDRFLSSRPELTPCGFRTVHDGNRVYIMPAQAVDDPLTDDNLVGIRNGKARPQTFPEVFDGIGTEILTSADGEIIIMDELGVMETEATRFTAKVLELLDGDTPVLGVIKPKHSAFLDAVRAHPKSTVIEVSEKSRDEVFGLVSKAYAVRL